MAPYPGSHICTGLLCILFRCHTGVPPWTPWGMESWPTALLFTTVISISVDIAPLPGRHEENQQTSLYGENHLYLFWDHFCCHLCFPAQPWSFLLGTDVLISFSWPVSTSPPLEGKTILKDLKLTQWRKRHLKKEKGRTALDFAVILTVVPTHTSVLTVSTA